MIVYLFSVTGEFNLLFVRRMIRPAEIQKRDSKLADQRIEKLIIGKFSI